MMNRNFYNIFTEKMSSPIQNSKTMQIAIPKKTRNDPNLLDIAEKFNKKTVPMNHKFLCIFKLYPSIKEYNENLTKICEYYQIDCDDWYALIEADNLFRDNESIKMGMDAIFSDYLGGPIIVNLSVEPTPPYQLSYKIGLVCEYQINNSWSTELINVMTTIEEFWHTIHILENTFTRAIDDKDIEAKIIYDGLIKNHSKKNISSSVMKYNGMHPTWSFIKLDNPHDKPIVPYIRKNDRCINDININLMQTTQLIKQNIYAFRNDFGGYIPNIILYFIGNMGPPDAMAICFNKTIVVKHYIYPGYRLRILVKSPDKIQTCKKFMETIFINDIAKRDKCAYADCVAKISIPNL